MYLHERFKNKIALITGGATGIGKAVGQRLSKEGALLILFDIDKENLEATVNEIRNEGQQANGFVVNIANETEVKEAILEIEEEFGRIDILINAAGIVGPTSTNITDYSADDFDKICKVNLTGTFLITKYVLQSMKNSGKGRLLLISSMAGKEGNPGMVGYSATKAGVIGLVKGVAKEYAETEITINGLAPAVIKTSLNEKTSPAQLEYMVAKIPMKRLGTVEEVAAISAYIVSDENSFSTGFIYDISGGRATY